MWTRDDTRAGFHGRFVRYAQVKTTKWVVVKFDVLSKETSMMEKPTVEMVDLILHSGMLMLLFIYSTCMSYCVDCAFIANVIP